MPYVTVLDFNVGKAYIYKYSDSLQDIEDFIDSKNHILMKKVEINARKIKN